MEIGVRFKRKVAVGHLDSISTLKDLDDTESHFLGKITLLRPLYNHVRIRSKRDNWFLVKAK